MLAGAVKDQSEQNEQSEQREDFQVPIALGSPPSLLVSPPAGIPEIPEIPEARVGTSAPTPHHECYDRPKRGNWGGFCGEPGGMRLALFACWLQWSQPTFKGRQCG